MTLTEILGSTSGARLALAQGEAALSAQETPHPRPARGGARPGQPYPSAPRGLGVGGSRCSRGVPTGTHPHDTSQPGSPPKNALPA